MTDLANLLVFVILVPILIGVAIMTINERRLLALIQRRFGPNIVGVYGLLQPFSIQAGGFPS